MKRTILAILLALALLVIPASSAFAATTATVSVTATPAIVSITNAPGTWAIDSPNKVTRVTTYYSNPLGEKTAPSNPVVVGECRFTLTNAGDVTVNTTISMSDFVAAGMTNGGTGYGASGATAFGASFYLNGAAWPVGAPEILTTGNTAFVSALPANVGNTKLWGIALKTQTDSFTSAAVQTSTVNIIATEV